MRDHAAIGDSQITNHKSEMANGSADPRMLERQHVLACGLPFARQIAVALHPRYAHVQLVADRVTAFATAWKDIVFVEQHDVG